MRTNRFSNAMATMDFGRGLRAASERFFGDTYRDETDWQSRIRSVKVVAEALNKGDLARAMMAAVLMRLPEPGGAIGISDVDRNLAKAGYDPNEPRDERGRWSNGGNDNPTRLIPVQLGGTLAEPFWGPLIEEIPANPVPMPAPYDIVPPIADPRGLSREPASNPFPRRRKCAKEWAAAEKFCRDLVNRGHLGADGHKGFGGTYDQCVRGQVSAECGGNSTAFEIA